MSDGTLIARLNGKVNFTGNCWDDLDTIPDISMYEQSKWWVYHDK